MPSKPWILLGIMLLAASAASAFSNAALRGTQRRMLVYPKLSALVIPAAYQRRFQYISSSSSNNNEPISSSDSKESSVKNSTVESEFTSKQKDQNQTTPEKPEPTYWSLSPTFFGRGLRKGAGRVASTLGFLTSSSTALVTDRAHFRRMKPSVEAFQKFLNTSGIYLELSHSLNRHLLRDLIVLGRVQGILASRRDPRELAKSKKKIEIPSREEALRYMRYSTAVYGNNMIVAAELDAKGKFDTRLSPLTRTRISEHIGIPEQEIVLIDVDYDGDGNHLRHFVAVDHENQKVVLSIRGTFNLNEVIVDIAAFSRPCFGGEAHSEMYTMAERVWNSAGSTVLELLEENDGYEFIITGHSLGAGTACLLNIMCHRHRESLVGGRNVRCFAYAAPPVFTPLELIPEAVQSTTNYIHGMDVVPFLSVDSVRHVFSAVKVVEEHMSALSRTSRFKLTAGIEDPDEEFIQAVLEASHKRLKPKQGAPILAIPAAATVWMREQESGQYDYEICDPDLLSTLGITINLRMADDHVPPRYENAFENLIEDN